MDSSLSNVVNLFALVHEGMGTFGADLLFVLDSGQDFRLLLWEFFHRTITDGED